MDLLMDLAMMILMINNNDNNNSNNNNNNNNNNKNLIMHDQNRAITYQAFNQVRLNNA